MRPYSTVSPITQRLVQVHAIVEKIAGVNGPLKNHVRMFTIFRHGKNRDVTRAGNMDKM